MFPSFRSSLSLSRDTCRSAGRPSRLTLGFAAAAMAGVTVVAGATPPAGAAAHLGPTSRAGAVGAAGHAAARHQAPVRHRAKPARPAAPYLVYDSVIPSAIPAHSMVATYATGPYAATPSQVAGRGPVLWIDVYGTDYNASALDVEPSDATPDVAANWARRRLSLHPDAMAHIYTSLSEWPAVQAAVATLPAWMRARIRWWIADPTGVPHIVPGSDATQWYWGSGYDITTATPRF